jgi:AraC-like DNA-binding protein
MTEQTILQIKNMVCDRCIRVVKLELESLGIDGAEIELGKVVVKNPLTNEQIENIRTKLQENGLELLHNRKMKLIESVKRLARDIARNPKKIRGNYSAYISRSVGVEYPYISTLFSSTENITIEQYIIHQKIEYIKELIVYEEYTISEIANMLGYSSTAHLSNQFKKVTGLTPSYYRQLKTERRKALDTLG